MEIAAKILIGLVVGILIGMTGLGGGVLLLPLLIFGLKVPPILAVGSDAVFNFITKIGSGWMHLRKGTVRRKVVMALEIGRASCRERVEVSVVACRTAVMVCVGV